MRTWRLSSSRARRAVLLSPDDLGSDEDAGDCRMRFFKFGSRSRIHKSRTSHRACEATPTDRTVAASGEPSSSPEAADASRRRNGVPLWCTTAWRRFRRHFGSRSSGGSPMTQTGFVSFATHTVRQCRLTGRRWRPPRVANLALTLAAMLFAVPITAQAQQGTVNGTVVVEGAQRPLAGAQVVVEGQNNIGAVTDASGRFRISGLTGTSVTLSVRSLGYRPETQTVTIGANNIRFVLSARAVELNQVVVTGTAGGEQLRSLGTSVAAVNVSDVTAKTAV